MRKRSRRSLSAWGARGTQTLYAGIWTIFLAYPIEHIAANPELVRSQRVTGFVLIGLFVLPVRILAGGRHAGDLALATLDASLALGISGRDMPAQRRGGPRRSVGGRRDVRLSVGLHPLPNVDIRSPDGPRARGRRAVGGPDRRRPATVVAHRAAVDGHDSAGRMYQSGVEQQPARAEQAAQDRGHLCRAGEDRLRRP